MLLLALIFLVPLVVGAGVVARTRHQNRLRYARCLENIARLEAEFLWPDVLAMYAPYLWQRTWLRRFAPKPVRQTHYTQVFGLGSARAYSSSAATLAPLSKRAIRSAAEAEIRQLLASHGLLESGLAQQALAHKRAVESHVLH